MIVDYLSVIVDYLAVQVGHLSVIVDPTCVLDARAGGLSFCAS